MKNQKGKFMKKTKKKWFDSAIMKEDESKTTTNSKHFVANNRTRTAVFSSSNMNYFDETEKRWKLIDNTLKKNEEGYQAQLGTYTAKLPTLSENETVELSNGSDIIAWEYLGTNQNVFSFPSVGNSGKSVKSKSKLNVKARIRDALNLADASRAVYENAEGLLNNLFGKK